MHQSKLPDRLEEMSNGFAACCFKSSHIFERSVSLSQPRWKDLGSAAGGQSVSWLVSAFALVFCTWLLCLSRLQSQGTTLASQVHKQIECKRA